MKNKFVALNNEQIKKENYDRYRKIRKSWSISPVTKVKPNKKLYKRALTKKEIHKILKEDDL